MNKKNIFFVIAALTVAIPASAVMAELNEDSVARLSEEQGKILKGLNEDFVNNAIAFYCGAVLKKQYDPATIAYYQKISEEFSKRQKDLVTSYNSNTDHAMAAEWLARGFFAGYHLGVQSTLNQELGIANVDIEKVCEWPQQRLQKK